MIYYQNYVKNWCKILLSCCKRLVFTCLGFKRYIPDINAAVFAINAPHGSSCSDTHLCLKTAGWARGSHRQAGARLSHTHRICEDFNNDPLGLMIENRSGVNSSMHMLMWCGTGIYICRPLLEAWQTVLDCTRIDSFPQTHRQQSWWRRFLWTGSHKAVTIRRWSRRKRRTGHTYRVWFNRDLQHHTTRFISSPNQRLTKLNRNQRPSQLRLRKEAAHLQAVSIRASMHFGFYSCEWK